MTEQLDTPAGGPDTLPPPSFTYSESGDCTALFAALSEAQGEYLVAKKTSTNPHFKSKFAPLDEVIEATKAANAKHGLSMLQPLITDSDGRLFLLTILSHKSGGSLRFIAPLGEVEDVQDLGSKLTYMRRYTRSSILGIATDDDDDGNAAKAAQQSRKEPSAPKPSGPNVPKEVIDEVFAAAKDKGLPKAEFYARAKAVCGKDWLEFSEGDAKKLLADLVMK